MRFHFLIQPIAPSLPPAIHPLEKRLGSRAKYVYACIPPVIGAITAAVSCTNDSGGYVCLTHYYFVATLLLVPYYEQRLLKTSYIVTIVVNAAAMIAFPAGFLKLHTLIGWIFTAVVYTVLLAACCFISYRTTTLFGIVDKKEKDLKNILSEVQVLSDELLAAGTALSAVSENESASAELLAATVVIAPMTGGMQAYTYFALLPSLFSSSLVITAKSPENRNTHSLRPPFKKIMTKAQPETATPKIYKNKMLLISFSSFFVDCACILIPVLKIT